MDNESKVLELEKRVEELERTLGSHTHSGNDGSSYVYQDSITQKQGQTFKSGSSEWVGLDSGQNLQGFWVVGKDASTVDGWDNAQLTIQHQIETNGSTNQTFFFGYRGRGYMGVTGEVATGGNLFKQTEYEFENGALTGLVIFVNYSASNFEGFNIVSNTKNTITIDGVFSSSVSGATYFISIPIYLGSANYPWRRAYVLEGAGGGVRFGQGATGGGQNGLLYMDGSSGRLQFRRPNGTVDTV